MKTVRRKLSEFSQRFAEENVIGAIFWLVVIAGISLAWYRGEFSDKRAPIVSLPLELEVLDCECTCKPK